MLDKIDREYSEPRETKLNNTENSENRRLQLKTEYSQPRRKS